jgi:hypothetical protein
MRNVLLAAAFGCVVGFGVCAPAGATHPAENERIVVRLDGQSVVDGAGNVGRGDPDATAVAVLEHDHGTLVWTVTYQNVGGQNISGFHVHGPNAPHGVNGPEFINLIPLPAANFTLPNGTLSGIVTPEHDPGLQTKMAFLFFGIDGVDEFYLDLHTDGPGGFPAGAVRGQLPEPSALGVVAVCFVAALRRRTRLP